MRRPAGQRGQSMLEYALISGTVVIAFAAAGQLGLSDVFLRNLDTADSTYNVQLPDSLSLSEIANSADSFNQQINLR
jgi:hypothetical protein